MQIWNYNPATGELVGASTADPDPTSEGSWLIPAHATSVAPPAAQSGLAAVFSGASWSMVADHRGETWWLTTQQYNDVPGLVINSLGDPAAADLTQTEPPAPPVVVQPIVVTAWQIRKALTQLGLRAAVEAYVAAADQDTKDGWEYAADFEQGNSMIETAAAAIGKTPGDVDGLFALAKTL